MLVVMTVTLTAVLAALSLLFLGLESWRPAIRGQKHLRRGWRTDVIYWFIVSTIGKWFARAIVLLGIALLGILATQSLDRDAIKAWAMRDTPLQRQPWALQAFEILVLTDFVGYWSHRMFHAWPPAWRFHAIHHSSTEVDWLSAVRLHPINDAVSNVLTAAAFVLVGFDAKTLAFAVPFFTLYAIALHANLDWSVGPLRYVVASPVYHRWHHTTEEEGLDKNFAGLFPAYDLIFGTAYLPKGQQPRKFGISGEPVPDSFWGQLIYPFRPAARATLAPPPSE
ncbi:MAG: fatty acid hydroxylase family protein [Dehalococcoidia bacterium]|nr:MAG: fatty acid hydroxylase family protein [Dehalococcoidia bacterium]